MAREKTLVSLAIETTRKAVLTSFSQLKNYEEITRLNYYNFLVKFLRNINKLSDILDYVLDEISRYLPKLQKNILEKDPEEINYSYEIYPFCRGIESLGLMRRISFLDILKDGIKTLNYLLTSDYYFYIDNIAQAVPLAQAIFRAYYPIKNIIEYRNIVNSSVDKLKELLGELDPNLRTIHGKDLHFSIKLHKNRGLTNTEKQILLRDARSKYLLRIIKAVEYLTAFKVDPPTETIDFLIRDFSMYFNDIFRLSNGNFEYYTSIIESLYNVLNYYNNKDFAYALFRSLIESSDWIISEGDGLHDSVKVILGTGLLVMSKSAIHR